MLRGEETLEKKARNSVELRKTAPPTAGVATNPWDLALVRGADGMVHGSSNGDLLKHERSTGPWKVMVV